MKILIVDDEPLAQKRIQKLLDSVPQVKMVRSCTNGKSTLSILKEYRPDLIFLDVQLQDMTGFDILQKLPPDFKPYIIFITAYDNYALQAFEFNAFDYLLKPFKDERFFKAMKKVLDISNEDLINGFDERLKILQDWQESLKKKNTLVKKLPLKVGNNTVLIDTSSIKYICASGYYSEIFTEDGKHVLRESLSNLYKTLDDEEFYRIHRSTIVKLNYIQEIVHSDYAEIDIRMKDKKLFSVSKAQKKDLLKRIGMRKG